MNTHFAITIGPIVQTLRNTRATKAMWSASYLFSWLMRRLLEQLKDREGLEILNLSYPAEGFAERNQVGLFPDRLIVRGNSPDLHTIATNIVKELAELIADDLNNPKIRSKAKYNGQQTPQYATKEDIEAFLKNYLRILCLEINLDEEQSKTPVPVLDTYLNSMELEATFQPVEKDDYLGVFLEDLFFNHFIQTEFGTDAGFASTVEVASATFGKLDETKAAYAKAVSKLRAFNPEAEDDSAQKQEDFVQTVTKIADKNFSLCHKYVAVVQADGDNMGHLFRSVPEAIQQELTKSLMAFGIEACRAIRSYGGVPVYAGGDDLLFFAPVSVEGELLFIDQRAKGSIFDLVNTIDKLFDKKIKSTPGIDISLLQGKEPSMSYGISISHYKYPLGESLGIAQSGLFGDIKSSNRRNGISWKITKHSGTNFGCVFQKNTNLFECFKSLLAARLPGAASIQTDTFLASLIFKLESLEGLFSATAGSDQQVNHFYNIIFNNFNESIHRASNDGTKLSPYLTKVVALLNAVFQAHPVSKASNTEKRRQQVQRNLQTAYAALRFVHFLHTSDKE